MSTTARVLTGLAAGIIIGITLFIGGSLQVFGFAAGAALLVALLITGKTGGLSGNAVLAIAGQLLLPFLAGHLLRRWIGPWIARAKQLTTLVDRGAILLVVGIWLLTKATGVL